MIRSCVLEADVPSVQSLTRIDYDLDAGELILTGNPVPLDLVACGVFDAVTLEGTLRIAFKRINVHLLSDDLEKIVLQLVSVHYL